jgi:hypothetical protein
MNKTIIGLELIIILSLTIGILVPDWDRIPVVKDYFALLVIGELGFDLYLRLKDKI